MRLLLAVVALLIGFETQAQVPLPPEIKPTFASLVSPPAVTDAATILLSWTNSGPVRIWRSPDMVSWQFYTMATNSPLDVSGYDQMFFEADLPPFTSVTLAWDPSSDARLAYYNLYWGDKHLTYTNKLECMDAGCTIPGLNRSTTYYFCVTTVVFNGLESVHSEEITWTSSAQSMVPLSISLH